MTLCIPISQANYHPWRLNTLLLADENFNKFISSEITSFLEINQTPGMSPLTVWESMKAYLRGQIISYSAQQRKLHNMKLEQLANDILKLDSILATTPSNDLFKQQMTLQTDFNLLSTRQIENLINKTQSKIYECGEKTGKILAHQLHQKTADRTIAEIKDESGIKHIDHSEINSCYRKFYTKLYDSESMGFLVNSLKKICRPTFSHPAFFFMRNHFSLVPFLSLILKKDKDSLDCGSYRPISLLNVDGKILSKILACRLETILPSIVAADQTGFIKGRHSFFNIRRLLNILYGPTSCDISEILLT